LGLIRRSRFLLPPNEDDIEDQNKPDGEELLKLVSSLVIRDILIKYGDLCPEFCLIIVQRLSRGGMK
jgi:hypothetical protein